MFNDAISQIKKDKLIYIMIFPGILFYLIFLYAPMFGIVIAFKEYYPFTGIEGIFTSKWVGFDNFIRYFNTPSFWSTLRNTLLLSLYRLLFDFPFPIILALVINEIASLKFKKFVQTVSYLPHFLSVVVVVGILGTLVSTDGGLINQIISYFGGEPVMFLGEEKYYRSIIIITSMWKEAGWGSIIYLAAISGVDPQLYEAATIDGAGRLRQAWNITLPSIAPVITIMLVLFMGTVLTSNFELILLTYSPATYSVGDTIDTFVYREGIVNQNFSFSTAVNLFKSVFSAGLLLMTNFISKKIGQSGIW